MTKTADPKIQTNVDHRLETLCRSIQDVISLYGADVFDPANTRPGASDFRGLVLAALRTYRSHLPKQYSDRMQDLSVAHGIIEAVYGDITTGALSCSPATQIASARNEDAIDILFGDDTAAPDTLAISLTRPDEASVLRQMSLLIRDLRTAGMCPVAIQYGMLEKGFEKPSIELVGTATAIAGLNEAVSKAPCHFPWSLTGHFAPSDAVVRRPARVASVQVWRASPEIASTGLFETSATIFKINEDLYRIRSAINT